MTFTKILIETPMVLCLLSALHIKCFVLCNTIIYITFLDEIVFRYMFFMFFSNKEAINCVYSGCLYSLYGYLTVPSIYSVISYGILGTVFALSRQKYSLTELIFFRLVINMYALSIVT